MRDLRCAALVGATLIGILLFPPGAAMGAWTTHGPDGGQVRVLAIDPSNPSRIYAAAFFGAGVFRSTDGGSHWNAANTGLTRLNVAALAIDPSTTNVLYAGTDDQGLFKSTDGGQTWIPIGGGAISSAGSIAIDPSSPETLYAAGGSVFKSTDGGRSWTALSGLDSIGVLAIDPSAPATLYAAGDGVFKSTDGGQSWTKTSFTSADSVSALVIDPTSPSSVYAGTFTEDDYRYGDVFRSADGGATWTASHVDQNVFALAVARSAPAVVYAATGTGVFSSRGGGIFSSAGSNVGVFTLAVDPSRPAVLYGGTGAGVYKSGDGGHLWTPLGTGLIASSVTALAIDSVEPSILYAGTTDRAARSTDGGASWTTIRDNTYVTALAVDTSTRGALYVAAPYGGFFKSLDGGVGWSDLSGALGIVNVNVLAVDPSAPATLYAGADEGFFKSTDAGESWDALGTGLIYRVLALRIDPTATAKLYAGTDAGIFKSTDGGTSWAVSLAGGAFDSLALDPSTPATVYAGGSGGVFKSSDGGQSWTLIHADVFVHSVIVDPSHPERLFAGTDGNGVVASTDSGSTWAPINDGLRNLYVEALAIEPAQLSRLHAGTYGGGVFDVDLSSDLPGLPCVVSEKRLCLVDGRYAVDLVALAASPSASAPVAAHALGDRAGYFAFPATTHDADLPEVVVKMLPDGSLGSRSAPVFYASLTTLPYVLEVTDTVTGEVRSYDSNSLCGGVDIPPIARDASVSERRFPTEATSGLSLLGNRFWITLQALKPDGRLATPIVMASGDRFGFFSFPDLTGDPQFPEVAVKMLDARALDGRFWFFYTGLTSLDYTLTVTDSVTGEVRTYDSAAPFCGAADTESFIDDPWGY